MQPEVVITDLHRSYLTGSGAERSALGGVDLVIPGGGLTALIGPSGSGKSTLLRLIGGLDSPDRGAVAVAGRDPRLVRAEGMIGLIPQSPALLPWRSVADNVALLDQMGPWSPRLSGDDIDGWLDRVGLGGDADLMPHQLSGGMQQRVALARAFAIEPSLLLMDEPFSALDELTRHDMQNLLTDLRRDRQPTVVFVTHSIDEAVKLADRVVVFTPAPGRIAAQIDIDLGMGPIDRERLGVEDEPAFRSYAANVRAALGGLVR